MNMDSVFQLAINADCKTTQALLCTCRVLDQFNFWKRKFDHQYPNAVYHNWWTAQENCELQEYEGKMQVYLAFVGKGKVDCILYKQDPIRERLLSLNYNIPSITRLYEFVDVDLTLTGEYALFEFEYDEISELKHIASFESEIEAKEFANKRRKEFEITAFRYMIVKLSDLTLEFSLKATGNILKSVKSLVA